LVTAVLFAPCPNITLAARQITQLAERCKMTSKPDPIYCAIAAYRGSWHRPDTRFADAVRATVEKGNAPKLRYAEGIVFRRKRGRVRDTDARPTGRSHCAGANARRSSARLVKCAVSRETSEAGQCIGRRAEPRSGCTGTALA
jgi:hypothetical protein